MRREVRVTLNGTTPTPYTRQLSPYNVWLMRVLMSLPNVGYRPGRILAVKPTKSRFRVSFDDGARETFDRVVTRYGPSGIVTREPLCSRAFHDPHFGEWLLTPVHYEVRTGHTNIWASINPAEHCVTSRLKGIEVRRGSSPGAPLNKEMYALRLQAGSELRVVDDERYRDPQSWLSACLRSGRRPSYIEGDGR